MTWVYLDDGFYNDDKIARAGGDAGWLYVCALCYCRGKKNGGIFPKSVIGQLSDRKAPAGLAERLVKVGLWEELGDDYSIHHYEEWNKLAEEEQRLRSEKAQRAALARWHSNAPPDAKAMPAPCSPDAKGDAPPDAQTMPSPSTPSGERQSSTNGCKAMPEQTTTTDEILNETWEILAQRDRSAKYAETGKHPRSPDAWLKSAAERRRSRHESDARRILESEPQTTPEQLADSLDRVGPAAPRPKAFGAPAECSNSACVNGFVEDDDGNVVPCSKCRRAQ